MKRVIASLILGLALGYEWGYREGNEGKPPVVARTLDHFGASKIRAAQEARDERVEEASKP
ncbi:MAG TPA: hypothetical protein VN651_00630 [Gemmatimonadaceae bacterium]|nr:hypothetical protein [Gemmatimonadaceae bacterium]